MPTIAFIGLGNMGAPMALNLLKHGYSLQVFDLQATAMERLAAAGATLAGSALQAAEKAEIVITMLPASVHAEQVYLGKSGLIETLSADKLLIDSSTIAPDIAQKIARHAVAKGFRMLDAPVSGGTAGAAAGTLTFIVGGASADLETARPLFEAMGKHIFHAGDHGAGQSAKICNNMLLAIHMIGTAETLQLGVNLGLDPKVLSQIMLQSSGRNWSLELYNPYPGVMESVPASRGYTGGFGGPLMNKDLGLAQEAAIQSHSSTPMGALAKSLYQQWINLGNESKDFSGIQGLF
ncbi:MAG: 3-hydroxyisobutyrate dehydrogenase [Hahellaceae bacterium]|nr:3-hydroxyisobutyrate dehydrogenase [Hahellaceae bacterium]